MKLRFYEGRVLWLMIALKCGSTKGLAEGDYIIESTTIDDEVRLRPPIGNGHVATNVLSDTVYMNGLYSGLDDSSSRARIPAYVTLDVDVSDQPDVKKTFVLNMYNGYFRQVIKTQTVDVNVTYLAHRKFTRLLVTTIEVRRRSGADGDILLPLISLKGNNSQDLTANHADFPGNFTDMGNNTRYYYGAIRQPEIAGTEPTTLFVYYTQVPKEAILLAEEDTLTLTFVTSHSINHTDALNQYKHALDDPYELVQSHFKASRALWDTGRIDIHDNKDLAKTVTASMYNIYCSLPAEDDVINPFFGLGPGGLSRGGLLYPEKPGGPRNDYAGHVFWDMDTWVMPAMLMFQPEMARRMLGARTRVLDQAKKNAKEDGYKGAKFPWEQAATGIETTPKWAGNMSRYEIHISADVSYALRQYLYATLDQKILQHGRGFELAIELARFWQSRVTRRIDGNFLDILGVMGPDEYHFNVNNSVYTNYNAILCLRLPRYIVETFDMPLTNDLISELDMFDQTADQIIVLFNDTLNYHPQYADFNLSAPIKQSDVVLLGYPLMMPMSAKVRQNDLLLYEKITDPQGPSTGTWSMHTVGWLEVGDVQRSRDAFNMMMRNVNEPFKVFSEKPITKSAYGGCVNFITGAGGLLQALLFGYGGLRLHPGHLSINMAAPPGTTAWQLTGVHYRGCRLNLRLRDDRVTIVVNSKPPGSRISIILAHRAETDLELYEEFQYSPQPAILAVTQETKYFHELMPTAGFQHLEASVIGFVNCMVIHFLRR